MALISANFSKTLVIQLEKENEVSVLDISESDSMSDDLKKLLSILLILRQWVVIFAWVLEKVVSQSQQSGQTKTCS